MTRDDLLQFMRSEKYAVQTSVSAAGSPQAAVVGIAVTDAFEIVFDTVASSRKASNLRANRSIAFVIGGTRDGDERTVQYEGIADEPSGEELDRLCAVYYAKFPDGRDRLAWQVTLFFGTQSLLFYAGLAWLPSILRDEGYSAESAGTALALYALIGIPPSLVVPVLAARMRDQRALVVIATAFEVAAIAGLLLAPDVAFVWVACFAVGQGAAFSLALTLMVLRAPDADRAASLSALAQSVGYTIAAAGPFLLGALHDATDGWRAPLATMLALTAALLAAGLGAGRPGLVGTR